MGAKEFYVLRFLPVISLGEKLLLNFIDGWPWYVSGRLSGFGYRAKKLEIVGYRFADARILNLDCYFLAFARDGMMHLSQRRGRERFDGEFLEYFFRFRAQAALELHAHERRVHWRRVHLQSR